MFQVIYIREAHPADSARAAGEWSKVNEPETLAKRIEVAKKCRDETKMGIPVAVDDMDDTAAMLYDGYPDRLYIVTPDGKVAYNGAKGPRGFKPDEMVKKLEAILAAE